MIPTEKAKSLFERQETEFMSWIRNFHEAAFCFHWIRSKMGKRKFSAWLQQNFADHQISVITDMLDKLENTSTGQRILATVTHPDTFQFPEN